MGTSESLKVAPCGGGRAGFLSRVCTGKGAMIRRFVSEVLKGKAVSLLGSVPGSGADRNLTQVLRPPELTELLG